MESVKTKMRLIALRRLPTALLVSCLILSSPQMDILLPATDVEQHYHLVIVNPAPASQTVECVRWYILSPHEISLVAMMSSGCPCLMID